MAGYRPVSFSSASAPGMSKFEIDTFLGADLTNSPANVENTRSPDCENMIRDVPGKVRKRMGWRTVLELEGAVNGFHTCRDGAPLIHAGTKLYRQLMTGELPKGEKEGLKLRCPRGEKIEAEGYAGCIDTVTVYGKTLQAGSGVPGAANVRPIYGVGMQTNLIPAPKDWAAGFPVQGESVPNNGGGNRYYTAEVELAAGEYVLSSNYSFYAGRVSLAPIVNGSYGAYREYPATEIRIGASGKYALCVTNKDNATGIADWRGEIEWVMLNRGTKAAPYLPYGGQEYAAKVEINGQLRLLPLTAPLWDGDRVESSVLAEDGGRISRERHAQKMLVLDGTENFYQDAEVNNWFVVADNQIPFARSTYQCGVCSHYPWAQANWMSEDHVVFVGINEASGHYVAFKDSSYSTAAEFKAHLAAQYAAGTPVTVVYELAEEETYTHEAVELNGRDGRFVLRAEGELSADLRMAEELAGGLADGRSRSWLLADQLVIADGGTLWIYDGERVKPASEGAYVPTLTIGKGPKAGGQEFEGINLIQPKFTEQFLGTAADKAYQLSLAPLDAAAVTVELLQSDGSWRELAEGSDFSVDRTAGLVTFTAAPGVSPVSGQDNVKITAARTVEGYADRINRCDIGALFGVSGAADRLFLSGYAGLPNYDWYSGYNDPTYWDDGAYAVLGQSDSAIVGYSIVSARLAAHKDGREADRSVVVREGNLQNNKPAFPIVNTLQGEGAAAKWAFGYLANEPLFLTRLGVYAVTSQDITGEKISNLRSFYLNGALLSERGLEDAFAFVYKDMYWLCLNGHAYILDGLQATQTDRSAPYSTRQYAGFYCTNIPARVLWEQDGALWFGTAEGKVCRFCTEPGALTSYSDDGAPVRACWRTPDVFGKNFYRNKTFSRFYIGLASASATGFRALARVQGLWEELLRDFATARYFSYANLTYSKFTYSNDDSPRTIGDKIRIKKVDKAGFLVENGELNEPFALDSIALEFVETGYYKGG